MKFKTFGLLAMTLAMSSVVTAETAPSDNSRSEFVEDINGSKEAEKEAMRVIANSGSALKLYNFATGEVDIIDKVGDLTPEEGADYIPNVEELVDIYLKHISNKKATFEALMLVFTSPEAMEIVKLGRQQ